MKKKIIIYGVNFYPAKGGTSTVVENLVLQLKSKYDITIYCYRNPLAKAHIPGVTAIEFEHWAKGSLGSLIYFFFSALHILFFGRGDLVHAHKTDCALFIPLIRLRFKVMATSHEAPYKRDKWNGFQKAYFHVAEWLFIKSPLICTSISRPLAQYYENKYQKKVYFIPNGINFTPPADYDYGGLASFLPEGASLDQAYLLFSARRIMSTKGCHTLIEALKQIDYRGQLFISGELEHSPYLDRLRDLSQGLNVFFLGFVHPLHVLLALVSSADLFIFPSETEGMSIMLLEVASVGKPIVASDIPENTQIFAENEVVYFRSGNLEDLAEKLTFALANPRQMRQVGLRAQSHVYADYLWSDIASEYDYIYEQIT